MASRSRSSRTALGRIVLLALVAWTGCRSAATPPPNAARASSPASATVPASAVAATPMAPVAPQAPLAPLAPAASAPAAPSATAPQAPVPPYRNTVRWTTASEVDSFGFDVFRSENEAGPFVRLNARPIAGAGTSDESHAYVFVDETIDPAREYYYYVESISITGERERFTPINRARAKLPAPAPAPVP